MGGLGLTGGVGGGSPARFGGARAAGGMAAALWGAAAALNRLWEFRFGPKLSFPRTESAMTALRESVRPLGEWLREVIGVFQYTDSPMPLFAYALWCAAAVVLLMTALRLGTRRARLALMLSAATALATPVLLNAFLLRPIRWRGPGGHRPPGR